MFFTDYMKMFIEHFITRDLQDWLSTEKFECGLSIMLQNYDILFLFFFFQKGLCFGTHFS